VLQLIREMTAEGRTVVMCTHLLIEAEGLADQIVVLESGTDLLAGSQDELIRRYWPANVVWLDAEDPAQLDRMRDWEGVVAYSREGSNRQRGRVELQLDSLNRIPDFVDRLARDGVRLMRVEPHQPTLEDLYFAVRAERRSQGVEPAL
jgi:ABC-2 type transport system ATP-binding protein